LDRLHRSIIAGPDLPERQTGKKQRKKKPSVIPHRIHTPGKAVKQVFKSVIVQPFLDKPCKTTMTQAVEGPS
jgi:hypothetical protein